MAYVSKEEQVKNLLIDLKQIINSRNADIAINILKWTKEKILLDENEKNRQYYHSRNRKSNNPRIVKRGYIYGANLGKNIGSEQNGHSRPVVIIQETKDNANSPTIIVAPLTDAHDKNGNLKRLLPSHVLINNPQLSKESIIKLEHCRCISKNRLTEFMCNLNKDRNSINEINKKLNYVFCIK